MDSSSSSLAPPSQRSLNQLSTSIPGPSPESLIPHLLASKRSLSTVTDVYRANELCTSTRTALEDSVIITARTDFLRAGISSQLSVLNRLQENTAKTTRQGKEEFEAATHSLDVADAKLRGTLQRLRETLVEPQLRPAEEERRSLLDFVDEGGVDGLIGIIKGVMEGAEEGLRDFENGGTTFREEVESVHDLMNGGSGDGALPDQSRSPLPDILHAMEDHTMSMARDLESLVSHYDKCVIAVKHTEGGGDAASRIAKELPEGVDIGEDIAGPPEPISDEQRKELFSVIEGDAGQVESIVVDIKDRTSQMEILHELVENNRDENTRGHATMTTAFKVLENIGHKLPNYITQSQAFLLRWDSEKDRIDELLEELEGLTQFYNGFLRAYDNLLIEIGRRKTMEEKMEQELEAARVRLDDIYEADRAEREAFRQGQGDFLPVDIWPGLMSAPLRFEIAAVDEERTRVPNISKSVIHRAIRRVHGER